MLKHKYKKGDEVYLIGTLSDTEAYVRPGKVISSGPKQLSVSEDYPFPKKERRQYPPSTKSVLPVATTTFEEAVRLAKELLTSQLDESREVIAFRMENWVNYDGSHLMREYEEMERGFAVHFQRLAKVNTYEIVSTH
jgi:hypothetical protein